MVHGARASCGWLCASSQPAVCTPHGRPPARSPVTLPRMPMCRHGSAGFVATCGTGDSLMLQSLLTWTCQGRGIHAWAQSATQRKVCLCVCKVVMARRVSW